MSGFPRKNSKTESSLNFLQSGPRKFTKSDFSWKCPDPASSALTLFINAQYDWTTGVLDNGNEWRKFRAVPRLYPLRSLVCTLFNKGGSRRAFRLPGAGGDHFHCTVEPSPSHTLKALTSLNKESRPFFQGDNSIWSSPLFLPLAIAAFGGPQEYSSLAIIAFGAFESIVPKSYCRLGKMDKRSLDSLI